MKIQYLGTAAAEGIPALFCECDACKKARELGGRNIRTRSQAIIDDTILIDFPADTYMHFLKYNMPMSRLKTCLITHSHSDHLYTEDFEVRVLWFSHIPDKPTLTIYSGADGFAKISDGIKRYGARVNELCAMQVQPDDSFEVEGYTVTAIKAEHDPKSSPLLYVVEKDGKSIFYANDSSEYSDEATERLKALKKPIDVISLDCTEGCNDTTYIGHLSFNRCIALRKRLIAEGIASSNTTFILNHFSHNGKNVTYDEFVKIAEKEGFLVSYDGMVFEF